jgi:hypothetical protein
MTKYGMVSLGVVAAGQQGGCSSVSLGAETLKALMMLLNKMPPMLDIDRKPATIL